MTSKRSWFRDRSAVLRLGAVGGALALAVAGCGTLMPGGNTGGRDLGTAAAAGPGPGVTDDSVKVVFIAVDLDAVKKLTGFKTASVGDQQAQIQALEDWVNANGGLDGRRWTRSSGSTTRRPTRRPPKSSSATRSPRTTRPSRS